MNANTKGKCLNKNMKNTLSLIKMNHKYKIKTKTQAKLLNMKQFKYKWHNNKKFEKTKIKMLKVV